MSLALEMTYSFTAPQATPDEIVAARQWIAALPDGQYVFAALFEAWEETRRGDISATAFAKLLRDAGFRRKRLGKKKITAYARGRRGTRSAAKPAAGKRRGAAGALGRTPRSSPHLVDAALLALRWTAQLSDGAHAFSELRHAVRRMVRRRVHPAAVGRGARGMARATPASLAPASAGRKSPSIRASRRCASRPEGRRHAIPDSARRCAGDADQDGQHHRPQIGHSRSCTMSSSMPAPHAVFLRTTDTDMQLIMPCPAEVTEQGPDHGRRPAVP